MKQLSPLLQARRQYITQVIWAKHNSYLASMNSDVGGRQTVVLSHGQLQRTPDTAQNSCMHYINPRKKRVQGLGRNKYVHKIKRVLWICRSLSVSVLSLSSPFTQDNFIQIPVHK